MMIALPNFDGSFTCTLFLAKSEPPAVAGGLILIFTVANWDRSTARYRKRF
jgi:hypothetical protein